MTRPGPAGPRPVHPVPASIGAAIGHWADSTPGAPMLLEPGLPPLSYAGTAAAVASVTAALTQAGLARGDRVAVVTRNDMSGAVLLLAVLGLGTCCPVSPAWTSAELAAYLDVVRPRALVVPARPGPAVTQICQAGRHTVLRARPGGQPGTSELTGQCPGPSPHPAGHGGPDRACLILRTSGTTAAGKVVPLTPGNVAAAAAATGTAYHLTAADRRLAFMPLHHVQGLVGSLAAALLCGSSLLCLPEFEPAAALAALATGGITWFSATAAMHRLLLAAAPRGRPAVPALRFVRCGSGALDRRLRGELEQAYGVPVIESYGMSEAHQIASTPLPPSPAAEGMVPVLTSIGFLGRDGSVATGPGARGEIVIKGPNVAGRYLWPPDAADCFTGGWLRTGDLGALAADGSLVITGRARELIDTGGEKFAPQEIESALLGHPGVREAVAFGVPHATLGERAAAAVVPAPGAELEERQLLAYLAGRLARYKVPVRIVTVAAIPVTATGKISRRTLATALADQLGDLPGTAQPRRSPVEVALTRLWAGALDRPQVAADSEFAALGGDERAARLLAAGVQEVFGIGVDPGRLFGDLATARAMAGFVATERGARGSGPASRREDL